MMEQIFQYFSLNSIVIIIPLLHNLV